MVLLEFLFKAQCVEEEVSLREQNIAITIAPRETKPDVNQTMAIA